MVSAYWRLRRRSVVVGSVGALLLAACSATPEGRPGTVERIGGGTGSVSQSVSAVGGPGAPAGTGGAVSGGGPGLFIPAGLAPQTTGPTKSDGIFTPNNNREIYQKISTDYQEIVKLTNQVTEGKPLPAAEILLLYEAGMHTRIGLNSRPLRLFARDPERASEFPEEVAFYNSATFLDTPVYDAIRGAGSAADMTPGQRRQIIQKGIQRILYYWTRHYLEGAAKNGNAGWVEEGWAIYVGEEKDGKYPNSLAATALAREENFNKKGSVDEPLRRAMAAGHKALLEKNTAAYQEALREMTSRFNALFYLASARYLNESLKHAQGGNAENAKVAQAEGFAFYLSIQPKVAKADPEADKTIVEYYTSAPAQLSVQRRDAALAALNRAAGALLLKESDLVTPASFQ